MNVRVVTVLLTVAAPYFFWFGFKAWRKSRLIEDMPVSRVRSAAQGYAELSGECQSMADNVRGPLTRLPCVWWRYKIEERDLSSRSRSWRTIDSGTSETPFLLDDGTGQCLIDPRGAEIEGPTSTVWFGDSAQPGARIPNGPGIFGAFEHLLQAMQRYRYTEQRLQPGDRIYAIGDFRARGGVDAPDADAELTSVLRRWKQDQAALLGRFDTNHDGVLSGTEWEVARAAAREAVVAQRLAQPVAAKVNVLAKPSDGRNFLVAAVARPTLARRFRFQALASLVGFLGATTTLAWLLIRV
jgi:hypothetical protein